MKSSTLLCSASLLEWEGYLVVLQSYIFLCKLEMMATSRRDRDGTWSFSVTSGFMQGKLLLRKLSYTSKNISMLSASVALIKANLYLIFSAGCLCQNLNRVTVGYISMLIAMQCCHWCYRQECKADGCCHFLRAISNSWIENTQKITLNMLRNGHVRKQEMIKTTTNKTPNQR